MKKKIIIITTGGTIASKREKDYVSIDESENSIQKEISHAQEDLGYDIEIMSPINKNSEALYPSDWGKILSCIKQANESDADGVVVTHGTDTMVYSVAAAVTYNNLWNKKICFTGSFYSPDNPSSDAHFNLAASIKFVAADDDLKGVYLAFRDSEDIKKTKILNGLNVKPMDFDQQTFNSVYDEVVAISDYTKNTIKNNDISPINVPDIGQDLLPDEDELIKTQGDIAVLKLYPGMDKTMLLDCAKNRKIIIIEMYHSGSGPTDSINNDFIEFLKETDVTVLMGTFPRKYIDIPYSSTKEIQNVGAHIYSDLPTHFLYVFAFLSLSLGCSVDFIIKKLSDWELSY